jgi:PAS domain S-box-containing protein
MNDSELLQQLPDAVVFADSEGVIRLWNAAATRLFGFEAAEALGQRLDIIIPEQFREAHWRAFERALAETRTKYEGQSLPTRAMRSDGSVFYVELTFAIVTGAGGTALGALACARDISERWERDREMRRRLRELEANAAG